MGSEQIISQKQIDFIMERGVRHVTKMQQTANWKRHVNQWRQGEFEKRYPNEAKNNNKHKPSAMEIKSCRTCRYAKSCKERLRFTASGVASVGYDFKEFSCERWRSRNAARTSAEVKGLLKQFKKQMPTLTPTEDDDE